MYAVRFRWLAHGDHDHGQRDANHMPNNEDLDNSSRFHVLHRWFCWLKHHRSTCANETEEKKNVIRPHVCGGIEIESLRQL